MTIPFLSIQNLHASMGGQEILRGIDLKAGAGEIHFLMGPNGSGKSTFAHALMGHPAVRVTEGSIRFRGEEIGGRKPEERSRMGMYLGFQHPPELGGVSQMTFLRSMLVSRGEIPAAGEGFRAELTAATARLGLSDVVLERNVNEGFSGGEKKRNELLQLAVLRPSLAILDEFDSGMDVDGIRASAAMLKEFMDPGRLLLVITHYGRIAEHLKPDRVHLMVGGRIVDQGGPELVDQIEKVGFIPS